MGPRRRFAAPPSRVGPKCSRSACVSWPALWVRHLRRKKPICRVNRAETGESACSSAAPGRDPWVVQGVVDDGYAASTSTKANLLYARAAARHPTSLGATTCAQDGAQTNLSGAKRSATFAPPSTPCIHCIVNSSRCLALLCLYVR